MIEALHLGELDVAVGGLTEKSPWSKQAALTRPYVVVTSPTGSPESHVMAARMGENALLVALERYLYEHEAEVAEQVGGVEPRRTRPRSTRVCWPSGSSCRRRSPRPATRRPARVADTRLPRHTNRIRARPADGDHPFGFHRSVSLGYLVAASALLTMGNYLVWSRRWAWCRPSTPHRPDDRLRIHVLDGLADDRRPGVHAGAAGAARSGSDPRDVLRS